MSYPVTYYCPHCGTLVALEREGYLADKSVTPYPLEGWTYVAPTEPDAEGVGCGEAFYLSFVRYDEGREIDPRAESAPVEINPDPRPSGPRGPSGPGEAGGPSDSDGFW
ncbi:hypothetical protein DJ77_08110 [Halorubrum ezzemoulense]|nr:hypothetical protein DJ77_08110 [Halorubrum ezzemoulense]